MFAARVIQEGKKWLIGTFSSQKEAVKEAKRGIIAARKKRSEWMVEAMLSQVEVVDLARPGARRMLCDCELPSFGAEMALELD